jgi:hypothetical protein
MNACGRRHDGLHTINYKTLPKIRKLTHMRGGVTLLLLAAAILLGPSAGLADGQPTSSRVQTASSRYRFEDLIVARQPPTRGRKTILWLVSYFRLNRPLPFAPRGKYEGEEEGGPRLFDAYLSVDRHYYQEGGLETIGNDMSRHCYKEGAEVGPKEHQPRIGQLVSVSLVIHGRAVIKTRTRVRTLKMGGSVRKPNGELLNQTELPYEKAFGCSKKRGR